MQIMIERFCQQLEFKFQRNNARTLLLVLKKPLKDVLTRAIFDMRFPPYMSIYCNKILQITN